MVIPLVVNLASSAAYDLVKKLAARLRPADGEEPQVERGEIAAGGTDVIIVIRGTAWRDLVPAADQPARASIRHALRQGNHGMADAFTRRREALTSAD